MSVTGPPGFVASAAAGGIKAGGELDLALVATEDARAVPAAAVFTSNQVQAAPVQVSRAHLARSGGHAAAVLLTSGNANAATGDDGRRAAAALCAGVAEGVGCRPDEVLLCQTGLIGIPFPTEVALGGLTPLCAELDPGAGGAARAARAIMTTDTEPKVALVRRHGFSVGGMAKGAAMLAPDMATMLAALTTDAHAEPAALHTALRQAVADTFNTMSVDECTSTNDTVVVLASGRAGPVAAGVLTEALREACGILAEAMVADAEGATKVARIRVQGARDDHDAHRAARRVAASLLVKCSLNGADPYWGRVVSELGASGAVIDPDRISVSYGAVEVCRYGVGVAHDEAAVAAHMRGDRVRITCDLGIGAGQGEVLTTDLGYGYIDENRGTS